MDSDFLLIILKQLLKKRKDIKIVLMSATINQELFSSMKYILKDKKKKMMTMY